MSELLTVKETAEILRISRATLYKHIKSGKIRAAKVGGKTLFHEEDVWELTKTLDKLPSRNPYGRAGKPKVSHRQIQSDIPTVPDEVLAGAANLEEMTSRGKE